MKKCIVISDSFKGTLSSSLICSIAGEVIPQVFPNCKTVPIPVADGGEGTVECFMEAIGAEPHTIEVQGPYGAPLKATYATRDSLAIIEMASAAGLPLVGTNKDPSKTSSYGVGQIMADAVKNGCTEILLGLGGSCTNDGGCGAAAALGVAFTDAKGKSFVPVGGTLNQIAHIDRTKADKLLKGVKVTVMCDVDNPLCGNRGAAAVFGPQKGADEKMVKELDAGLQIMSDVIRCDLHKNIEVTPGAGAAGGMGGGCMAFFDAELKSGIDAVLDAVHFDEILEGTDLVITGEGKIDSQSVHGKVISGIAKHTKPRKIPLIAIVGCIDPSCGEIYDMGVTSIFNIDREVQSFEDLAPNSADNYRRTLNDILRLVRAFRR